MSDCPTLEKGQVPTIQLIKEALRHNPPGQSAMGCHVEYIHDAGFYIAYLLARLEPARGRSVKERMDRIIEDAKKRYFEMEARKSQPRTEVYVDGPIAVINTYR